MKCIVENCDELARNSCSIEGCDSHSMMCSLHWAGFQCLRCGIFVCGHHSAGCLKPGCRVRFCSNCSVAKDKRAQLARMRDGRCPTH